MTLDDAQELRPRETATETDREDGFHGLILTEHGGASPFETWTNAAAQVYEGLLLAHFAKRGTRMIVKIQI
jgi:hypothetical protein